jgi:2-polyprenyl-3-methyl-5-hydroxy-6-metoxy-1,4-benzoquinol methylase
LTTFGAAEHATDIDSTTIKERPSTKKHLAMDRKEKILRHIDKRGCGIEIGPSHNPIAPKNAGYKVYVIDHMSREELLCKYKDHGVNLNRIEEVDFVWQGQSYSELTGRTKYYDWIIASHVIEHTPDLIGFLNDCDAILKESGVISLVIPDKRYCFDHYRPITGISKIIDSHFQKSTIHSPGTVAEYYLNVVSQSGKKTWNTRKTGEYNFIHSLENALRGMRSVVNEKSYLDVHAWCFVPHSFRLLIHDLFCLGLIYIKEVDFFSTEGCEFYITLGRKGQGVNKSRMEMLNIIEHEIMDGLNVKKTLFGSVSKIKKILMRLTRHFA